MNIDSILTEWCYRLPKGYPTSTRDYEVLYNVLLETCNCSIEQARNIVNRAKGEIQLITEAVAIDSIQNQFLLKAIDEANKSEAFIEFLKLLPLEAETITLKLLNNLSYEQSQNFAELLYAYDSINEQILGSVDYKSGIAGNLFNLKPDGMGKGEIYISALIRNTSAQGGGKSYDLIQNGKTYEVKDYSNPKRKSSSIRLGTKATVTRFEFWDELTFTLKLLSQLRGKADNPKFNLQEILPGPLVESIAYLESRRFNILGGNVGLKDKYWIDQFYQEAHKLNSEIVGYTNVILRGPNQEPIEMSIEPITDTSGESFVIRPIRETTQNLTYVNTELRRLKYVRDPFQLDRDLQDAVNDIVGSELTFVVFRPDRVNVTRDFRYAVIDTGKIRIIEKDVTPDDLTDDIEDDKDMN
jgi:hypothetical protein